MHEQDFFKIFGKSDVRLSFHTDRFIWWRLIDFIFSNDVRIVTLPWNVLKYPMAKSNFNYNILAPQKVNSTFPCVFQLIFKPHLSRDSFIKLTTLICIPRKLSAKLISIWRVMQQKQCWSKISMIQVSRKMAAQKKAEHW